MNFSLKAMVTTLALVFASSAVYADKPEKDEHGKPYKEHKEYKYDKRDKEAYREHDKKCGAAKSVPYGLQKRAENTGKPLPPGWQKKLRKGEVMDRNVYEHGQIVKPIDKRGIVTISIDGKMVRLYQATREIIDILN